MSPTSKEIETMLETLRNGDALVKSMGIELVECGNGYGKATMPIDGRQTNVLGMVHGGAIFTLADMAMGMAAFGAGYLCVTLTSSISFLKPGIKGPLVAEARQISQASKIGNMEVTVKDADGQPVAQCSFVAYKKNPEHFQEALAQARASGK